VLALPVLRARLLDDEMQVYDAKALKRRFGIDSSAVRSLIRAGHIQPLKRAGRLHYSFQDLIVLRTASALRTARIPARKITIALQKMRASLPAGMPLSGLSIMVLGNQITVREGQQLWESDSGQYVLALQVISEGGDIEMIERPKPTHEALVGADQQFAEAFRLEASDVQAARRAYESCLATDSRHTQARVNLGRLLHLSGELDEAERIYRGDMSGDALLAFNLAVLLEDANREAEAIAMYRDALVLDPGLADAHFNLARLHERAGNTQGCFRHLLAYRRITNAQTT
jgi:tetratricopeptide (TPR) repeat protein